MSIYDEKIKAIFDELPEEPGPKLNAISAIYSSMRKQAAKHLQPTVTTLLNEAHQLDFDHKVQFARDVSQVLLDARLGIRDPENGRVATLTAVRPRPTSMVSYFFLRDNTLDPEGIRHTMPINEASKFRVRLVSMADHAIKPDRGSSRSGPQR